MRYTKIFILVLIALALIGYLTSYFYWEPKFVQGEKALDFELTILDGSRVKLSDFRGKYVLIEFWGSWCRPCREENPDLVDVYRSFHGQKLLNAEGFEIISIGVEKDSAAWLAAIEVDSLMWPCHASTADRFKDPIAELYEIHSIPSNYLVNPDGVIVGVNLRAKTLRQYLSDKMDEN